VTPDASVDVAALIDERPVSRFQVGLLLLLGASVVMDGFDAQAMGFVAPAIIRTWGVARGALGPVFSASLIGMLVGSLALSPLADRVGRRPVLIGSTLFFAVSMLATPLASTLTELFAVRFVTGIGLGGIMANAMALAGEYSPRRRRVSLMMWVSCGFTAGAMLGGLVSAVMIPRYGWASVFYVGGAIPIVIALLMLRFLPESMQFLVLHGKRLDHVHRWLGRIAPDANLDRSTVPVFSEVAREGSAVGELFRGGRTGTTLLLWAINFMNLLNLYFLSSWLPTLVTSIGYDLATAVLIGTVLQFGGVLGTIAMGPVIDRVGFYRVLIPVFAVATCAVFLVGRPGLSLGLLFIAVFVSGLCIVGGQPAINALAAMIYPTTIRSTGVGWSLGIGRAGSIVGPVVAGQLIGWKWDNGALFMAAAVPALLSCLMLIVMTRLKAARPSGHVADVVALPS
jgi:MFS transporter, AAHS family, 4-hydroxybenzoate transporter